MIPSGRVFEGEDSGEAAEPIFRTREKSLTPTVIVKSRDLQRESSMGAVLIMFRSWLMKYVPTETS
jgi:hypothetical protein